MIVIGELYPSIGMYDLKEINNSLAGLIIFKAEYEN